MKLSTKSEYAILAMIYLARQQEKGYVKISDICKHYSIPKKYLEILFTVLRHNGFIQTRRGADGGYQLAKPAEEISLAQVVRLMDGALAPTSSVSEYFYSDTPLQQEPGVLLIFREIRDFISDKLEATTLADFVIESVHNDEVE
ncbi:Rrf2 family transcriptional regulator [Clostridia bacterium]|nr:Rrf2 family transcriptional regulator [Clostridia bacterium]